MNKKRRILLITGVIIVALIGLVVAVGPYFYRDVISSEAPAAPKIETADSSVKAVELTDGTWTVDKDSYAGYRVDESLRGVDVTVVGRTSNVTGSSTVKDQKVTDGTITVDVASVATDQPARDFYFRSTIVDVERYPTATFTLTSATDISAIKDNPKVKLVGTLTLRGVTKDVTLDAEVGQSGEFIQVAGSIPITWSDYDIVAPNLGFVTVEENGQIEFLLSLNRVSR